MSLIVEGCISFHRCMSGLVQFRLCPLQKSQGKAQITIHPGTDRHGTAGIVKALASIPIKNIGI